MRQILLVILVLAGSASQQGASAGQNRDGAGGEVRPTPPTKCVERSSISITAEPTSLAFPNPTKVSWFASIPDDCQSLNVQLNDIVVVPVGVRTFTPSMNTDYVAVISDTSGISSSTKTASVKVVVTGMPATIRIDGTTLDPVEVLIGALAASPNLKQVIELCGDDLKLDFDGRRRIVVPSFRTLRAAPGCERSLRRLGPLAFSHMKGGGPLFVIRGDYVEFSGFRLEGPESGLGTDALGGAVGIQIQPAGCDSGQPNCVLPGLHHVEVSNMEIYQWDSAAIEVLDVAEHGTMSELGRLWNTNVGAVHIVNNFLHDNRHTHVGYGVEVGNGGYALIERNVFNQNRHAIAGGSHDAAGRDFSGYTARDNLVLPGGGLHCSTVADWTACWHTHSIDMHGDESHWYSGDRQCGRAGETMIIERNTVLYTNGPAIDIRGNPADKAVVSHNVFLHGSRTDAISQEGECHWYSRLTGQDVTNPIIVTPDNVYGVDPTTDLRSCNFGGRVEGQDVLDQFMATGLTWWVRSGANGQWRYLNTMSETTPALQLRDFDGDGHCDVLPRTRSPDVVPSYYSKSGATPWIPVGVVPPTN